MIVDENNLILSEQLTSYFLFIKRWTKLREDAAGKMLKLAQQEEELVLLMRIKIGRRSIRVMDLISEKILNHRLETVLNSS